VTGAPKKKLIGDFIEAISKKDLPGALALVQVAVKDNIDIRTFLKLVLHKLRIVLLLRYAPVLNASFENEVGEDEFKTLKAIASAQGSYINSQVVLELLDAQDKTKYAEITALPLELSLIKLMGAK
jgi:DNA polymerase III gamma/tau subunit